MARAISIKTFGQSMEPFFFDGDVVMIKNIPFSRIRLNDLVTIKKNSNLITHRIIYQSKKKAYLVTKGDNNLVVDGKIYPKDIIGKVENVKRNEEIIDPEHMYLIQSTYYFEEITKIKSALEKSHIDLVFLKGLPLHLYIENTHPRRIYMDCDVLVRKSDFPKTQVLLARLKYRKAGMPLSTIHTILKDKPTEEHYYKSINGFNVVFDLHAEAVFMMTQLGKLEPLHSQRLIDELTSEFLREKRIVRIQNKTFPILSTENLILYLTLHLFHHNFRGFARYEFLRSVIEKTKPDWGRISKKAVRFKLQNYVYPVFLLMRKYYNVPLANEFLEKIQPTEGSLQYVKKHILPMPIFDDETRLRAGINRFKNLFFLSPRPLWQRILVFLNLQVLFSLLWIAKRKYLTLGFFSFAALR